MLHEEEGYSMIYLSYVWRILSTHYGLIAVTFGKIFVLICLMRPRIKWWLYPLLITITYLSLPFLFKLTTILFGTSTSFSILMIYLGYWNYLLVLISFRERFWNMLSIIFTLSIFDRLFTFWGYLLYLPLKGLIGVDIDFQVSTTLVISIMYTIISLVLYFVLRDKGRELIQTKLPNHNWVVLSVIAVSAKLIIDFCSNYVFAMNPYTDRKILLAMIALCILVLALLVLYLYNTLFIIKQLELKVSTDRLVLEKESQQQYYETQLHNQKELRRMKHDMNGNLNTISRLLEDNNKEEALSFVSELCQYSNSHQKTLYSDDPFINAVVNNYASFFAENDITFEPEIKLGKIELHHVEKCLILNNGLQNALEASLLLLPEQRQVKLQIITKQGHLVLRITNRFDSKLILKDGWPQSTKMGEGHGYGLNSIRNAAESVGGFAVCKIKDDMFVLDVSM